MKLFGYLVTVPVFTLIMKKRGCIVQKMKEFNPYEFPPGLRPNQSNPATFESIENDPEFDMNKFLDLIDALIDERNKYKNETTIRFHDLFYTVL